MKKSFIKTNIFLFFICIISYISGFNIDSFDTIMNKLQIQSKPYKKRQDQVYGTWITTGDYSANGTYGLILYVTEVPGSLPHMKIEKYYLGELISARELIVSLAPEEVQNYIWFAEDPEFNEDQPWKGYGLLIDVRFDIHNKPYLYCEGDNSFRQIIYFVPKPLTEE